MPGDAERRRMMAELTAWHAEWADRWGIDDHPYDGLSIEDWQARIPPEAEADYQRRADEIMGIDRATGRRRVPPPGAPDPAAERHDDGGAGTPRPPLARTHDEAVLYLDVHPCPRCGAHRTRWESGALVDAHGELARRYTGDCGNCGEHREFVFRLPERIPAVPAGGGRHYGGDEPSEIIDPGQWLGMSDAAAEVAFADRASGDTTMAKARAELASGLAAEVLKFIPAGASAVPEPAVWTPAGRSLYAADPSRFTRRRLLLLLDMLREEFGPPAGPDAAPAASDAERAAPFAERAAPAAPDAERAAPFADRAAPGAPGAAQAGPAAAPRLPFARTSAELRLFLDLQPCVCGAQRADWAGRVRDLEDGLVAEYTARCPRCGRERLFTFLLPDEPVESGPEGAGFRYGGDQPSELLDPGEWLSAADTLARSVPMLPAAAGPQERDRFRFAIGRAAAALAEVMRFAPPGATAVPESACFTERGRAVHRDEPGRFRLDRLAAVRDSYLRLLALAEQ